jgi:hypothetical protein
MAGAECAACKWRLAFAAIAWNYGSGAVTVKSVKLWPPENWHLLDASLTTGIEGEASLQTEGDTVMKRIPIIALFTLASLFPVGNVLAQTHAVRAFVPFEFSVGNKLLPAGNYEFLSDKQDQILIRSRDQTQFAVLTRTADEDQMTWNNGKLIFNKYGDQYFLSEVLCSPAALSVDIPTSKMEKNAQHQMAELQSPDKKNATQVFIALK